MKFFSQGSFVFKILLGIISVVTVAQHLVADNKSSQKQKQLEFNVPACIRSAQFNRNLVVRAQFPDDATIKSTDTAAPFEFVAVADDNVASKDGSALIIFKSAKDPTRVGPIHYNNDTFTMHVVKAGTGSWTDKIGFLSSPRTVWTYPGSTLPDKDKNGVLIHYQPRVSDSTEKSLTKKAHHFVFKSKTGKTGIVHQNDDVLIVSKGSKAINNRIMWVSKSDYLDAYPILISSDDPLGKDPKNNLGGDRRFTAGVFNIGDINTTLLNDDGWKDLAKVTQPSKTDKAVATPGDDYAPGGKRFTFNPAVFGKNNGLFSENWKADSSGNLWVTWRSKAKADVMVKVSSTQDWEIKDPAHFYFVILGGYKNTDSEIRKGGDKLITGEIAKEKAVEVNDTTKQESMSVALDTWEDYWLSIEPQDQTKAVISVGRGQKVGERVMLSAVDEQPLAGVQYVGFGGFESVVEYDKITISGDGQAVQLPPDFIHIPSQEMTKIALGAFNGQALVYGLSKSGAVLQWNVGSINAQPWLQVDIKDQQGTKITKIIDVAAAADGTVGVVNSKNRLYLLNREKNYWSIVPNKMHKKKILIDRIAIGNAGTLLGLNLKESAIYFRQDNKWLLLSEKADLLDIAASFDGGIYALNDKHTLYTHDGKSWKELVPMSVSLEDKKSFLFNAVSAVNKQEFHSIALDAKKYKAYSFEKGSWDLLQGADGSDVVGLKSIIALPSTPRFIVVLDVHGNVYYKGESKIQLDTLTPGILTIMQQDEHVTTAGKTKKKKKKDVKSGQDKSKKKLEAIKFPIAAIKVPIKSVPVRPVNKFF